MKKLITTTILGTLMASSMAFGNSLADSKAAAIKAFKKSTAVLAAAKTKCGGTIMDEQEPVATLLHEGDMKGEYYPILVLQEIGCSFSSESVAAIVKTATRIDEQTAKLVYDSQDPVVVDLSALSK